MLIAEPQEIRDGLCDKVERLLAPGAPFDPATIARNGQGYDCGMCGRPHLHITPAVLKFWRYMDVNLACWELQKELKARQVQLSAAIAEADSKHGGFDEPELDIDARGLAHVAPAVVGPFGQLWARIEASDQAIVAATVFTAPRGFLAPRRRPGNGKSRDGDLAAKRAVGVFAAPRGFLSTL